MMDWTDRHCRAFHRLYAPHALLYTEMIVSAAIVRADSSETTWWAFLKNLRGDKN